MRRPVPVDTQQLATIRIVVQADPRSVRQASGETLIDGSIAALTLQWEPDSRSRLPRRFVFLRPLLLTEGSATTLGCGGKQPVNGELPQCSTPAHRRGFDKFPPLEGAVT